MDISIIIPTYNRKEKLRECLDSVFNQDYPQGNFEVIVVEDGFDCDTLNTGKELGIKYKNLKYIKQDHRGPAAARNRGVKVATGKIIGFVDDDCRVDKHWVKLMVDAHQKNPQAIAVGGFTSASTQKTPVLISQFLSTCAIETPVNDKTEVVFFPTCNVSLKKSVFDRYEFDNQFPFPGGEDLEFFWRLFKDGHRFIWDKNIKVMHYRDDTLCIFLKQAYFYGRGNFPVQHIHRDHPLLKELRTGIISFWAATFINFVKIPRFSYKLGRKFIKEENIKNNHKKLSVYAYFILHKIFYLSGNILEFIRIRKESLTWRYLSQVPRLLILDITHSCNLSCRICDIWKTGAIEEDINIRHIKNMLFQAKALGINEIALSGGEPLLRKDIFEIFDYAKSMKIKDLGVLTNGILVEKHFHKLKPYLIDNTISLVISLDSLISDTHNYIRNSDNAWEKTIESLKLSSALKKEYPRVSFNVITIILNKNLGELLEVALFIKSLGANSLQFQALLPNNLNMSERKSSAFWVPSEELPLLDKIIDKLIKFKQENPMFIKNSINNLSLVKKYYRCDITAGEINCLSAHKTVLVSNRGECTTCFSCYGDIKKQEFRDILKSKKILAAREKAEKCPSPCLLPCFCD